jgi:hypothetical protein
MATPLHYHRLLFGSVFIFIIFSFFHEMDVNRLDDTSGISIVGMIFFLFFTLLGRKLSE